MPILKTNSNVPISDNSDFLEKTLSEKKRWRIEIKYLPGNEVIFFHAFLKNIGETFNSDWSDDDVFGRMDPISIFKSTKRTMQISFDVPSSNIEQAIENIDTINKFTQFMYPVYKPVTSGKIPKLKSVNITGDQLDALYVKRGTKSQYMVSSPLLEIKFVNILQNSQNSNSSTKTRSGIICKVNGGLNITPDFQYGAFSENEGKLFPKLWTISFNLTIFHTHILGWQQNSNGITFSDNLKIGRNFPYGTR